MISKTELELFVWNLIIWLYVSIINMKKVLMLSGTTMRGMKSNNSAQRTQYYWNIETWSQIYLFIKPVASVSSINSDILGCNNNVFSLD